MNKYTYNCTSQWPYSLRRLDCWYCGFESRWGHECSAVVFLVVSGHCDELITRSGKSYRVGVSVCELETTTLRRPSLELGCWVTENTHTHTHTHTHIYIYIYIYSYSH